METGLPWQIFKTPNLSGFWIQIKWDSVISLNDNIDTMTIQSRLTFIFFQALLNLDES